MRHQSKSQLGCRNDAIQKPRQRSLDDSIEIIDKKGVIPSEFHDMKDLSPKIYTRKQVHQTQKQVHSMSLNKPPLRHSIRVK